MTDFAYSSRILSEELDVLREYTAAAPVKVGALAEALGLRVVLATLPMNISGLIKPDGDTFVIKVNRFESKERQRFTIAHEIAHYLIHKSYISTGVVDSVLYRSKLSSRLEAEANKLAADIIMPSDLVSNEVNKIRQYDHEQIVDSLAKVFSVSGQAMEIRLGG